MGPATTSQHALEELRRLIVVGELQPGQRIVQEDLAAALGVSVAPVREALRTLEQEGQVTYRPRRGYFVTELAIADLEEIYELRALLETHLAALITATLDEDALARIEFAAAEFADAVESGAVTDELQANRRFHLEILATSARPHTIRVLMQLWDATEAYRALYYNLPKERLDALRAHDRILDALRDRDPLRLKTELDTHRERALAVLRSILPGPPGSDDTH
ncbi:MAG: GntR family transcriptional regulator [Solirubrobacteraceae bacterium]